MSFILLNDKSQYNENYRSGIINQLIDNDFQYSSLGLFDGFLSFFRYLFSVLFLKRVFISSNMKSNIFFMLFFWRSGLVIVNGMGRNRKSTYFRCLMGFLFKINYKKKVAFQNYADFRYFSILYKRKFFWVPGSGGCKRKIGSSGDIVIVSRDSKLPLLGKSILKAFNFLSSKENVIFVGCTNEMVKRHFNYQPALGVGFLPQSDIFLHGYRFFQPQGYGEGIPHTLVDAICSGMKIYIHKKELVKFGFHRLGFKYLYVSSDIVELIYNEEQFFHLEQSNISSYYLSLTS